VLNAILSPIVGLSVLQARFFRDAGYLRLPGRFDETDVALLREKCVSEFERAEGPVQRDASGSVVRLSRIYARSEAFRDAFTAPIILGPLGSLLGPNIDFVLNRHNHVTVNGSRTKAARLHRDVLQWSRPIVSVLIYLDDANDQSGCTQVIPTSQLLPYVGTPNNGGTWMDEHHVFAGLPDQALPVPMLSGQILAVDGLIFHAAGEGSEPGTRFALSGAYHSVDELKSPPHPAQATVVLGNNIYRGDM